MIDVATKMAVRARGRGRIGQVQAAERMVDADPHCAMRSACGIATHQRSDS